MWDNFSQEIEEAMESIDPKITTPLTLTSFLKKWDDFLSDSFLGLLALITLFLALSPYVFDLSEGVDSTISIVQNTILLLFALEYVLSLFLAPAKWHFVLGFWRILDAIIIIISVLSFMPFVGDQFKHALSLRLLRFLRVALFSVKIRKIGMITVEHNEQRHALNEAVEAFNFTQSDVVSESWDAMIMRLKTKQEDWLLAGNINESHIEEVATILKVPPAKLSRLFFESQFPRIERMDKYTTLFLWLPSIVYAKKGNMPTIVRDAMLLVGSEHNVLVLSPKNISLSAEIMLQSKEYGDASALLPCMTWSFLKVVSLRYAEIIYQLEKELLQIDAQQENLRDKTFLDFTFTLRSELIRMRSNIKHLRHAIRQLSDKPISINGFSKPPRNLFAILFTDMDILYFGVDDLLTNLSALVDLRLNISSFQMNKVMRLLAIITTLTLIPAIAGGMLGMNLLDNPWPLTLAEVSYCVAAGISISLYIFAVRGWFK